MDAGVVHSKNPAKAVPVSTTLTIEDIKTYQLVSDYQMSCEDPL